MYRRNYGQSAGEYPEGETCGEGFSRPAGGTTFPAGARNRSSAHRIEPQDVTGEHHPSANEQRTEADTRYPPRVEAEDGPPAGPDNRAHLSQKSRLGAASRRAQGYLARSEARGYRACRGVIGRGGRAPRAPIIDAAIDLRSRDQRGILVRTLNGVRSVSVDRAIDYRNFVVVVVEIAEKRQPWTFPSSEG